jgi:hypothetical protein
MNGSARPSHKHDLLYLRPFGLTDRLETRQQTVVLLLSNRSCPLYVVAFHVLRLFDFNGQEFFSCCVFSCCVQSNSVQSSSPESFLILLFRYWQSRMRFRPRDLHLFVFRCFPQLFFRAELITPFLIPECSVPCFGALHVALEFDDRVVEKTKSNVRTIGSKKSADSENLGRKSDVGPQRG